MNEREGAGEVPGAASSSPTEMESGEGGVSGDPQEDPITVRLVMPDRWLEQVEELPADTTVEEAKRIGLRKLLLRETDDPDDFYVEYAEREIRDEGVTLSELGMEPREILSIRAYDLGHYPPFRG